MINAPKSDILKKLGSDIFFLMGDKVKGESAQDTPLVTTRIFPGEENPLGLALALGRVPGSISFASVTLR